MQAAAYDPASWQEEDGDIDGSPTLSSSPPADPFQLPVRHQLKRGQHGLMEYVLSLGTDSDDEMEKEIKKSSKRGDDHGATAASAVAAVSPSSADCIVPPRPPLCNGWTRPRSRSSSPSSSSRSMSASRSFSFSSSRSSLSVSHSAFSPSAFSCSDGGSHYASAVSSSVHPSISRSLASMSITPPSANPRHRHDKGRPCDSVDDGDGGRDAGEEENSEAEDSRSPSPRTRAARQMLKAAMDVKLKVTQHHHHRHHDRDRDRDRERHGRGERHRRSERDGEVRDRDRDREREKHIDRANVRLKPPSKPKVCRVSGCDELRVSGEKYCRVHAGPVPVPINPNARKMMFQH